MATPIMPTKLYIPPPRPEVVDRPRLLDRLDEGLLAGHRLTAIVAPAGSGKTTLVTSWIYSPTRPVASRALAWLSLDRDDNDPARFLSHFIAALRQIQPRAGRGAESLLGAPQVPRLSGLMTSLMADLAEGTTPGLLILDDYQTLSASEIHNGLEVFLTYQPSHLHLVVISREQLPFSLAQMRVRNAVTELDGRDLRFTLAEARLLLQRSLGASWPEAAIVQAVARTEGWAAGLQLLSLAARREGEGGSRPTHSATELASVAGGSHYIVDYLVTEVLSQQPAGVRSFLQATAILEHLCGALCDHMTGREDGEAMLAQLASAGLFVVPLDQEGRWYRYHRLFAEALIDTLQTPEREALHRRALNWFEANGMVAFAMQHALTLGELTDDWRPAERLARCHAEETARRGEMMTVRAWLDALPEAMVATDAYFTMLKAWILAMSGDLIGADRHARLAASLLDAPSDSTETKETAGKLQALRSFIMLLKDGDNPRARTLADEALKLLPDQEASWQILALWSRAEAEERLNHLTAAVDALRDAQRIGRSMRETLFAVVAEGGLVKSLNDQGCRREALAVCEDALAHYRDSKGVPLPLVGYIYSQLGGLQYEANDLAAAQGTHALALDLGGQLGLDYELIYQRALAAPTWYALGEVDRALAALREGFRHASQAGYADADWFLAWETNIHLWQGDFVAARHWAASLGLSPHDELRLLRIEQHVTYARLLIADGRHADARHWLARLERFTRDHSLFRWAITVNLLQAIVVDRRGDAASAQALVAQAIQAAAAEGYVRAFLVEGPRVVALTADLRRVAPSFVDRVRHGAETLTGHIPSQAAALTEPLTERETEVLQLIAGGATNREIAEQLVIAAGTVKRHTNHIYGKLQVHNRTEAVARARELGVL